ncbi:molybdenum cofactor guanylyltransferase [Halobacterium bonnevillei]|uniref:Probable molybdenum cofactor guanylyltransferase n=1 Tax=Halobacterium bonnevillei TaxID=2692200 RepID=A0A6B0SMT5_9EURY|nr:molybdenum cofactor guanylyltransferase [Halobacterium bonnevillei]MXR22527.1 NTP transferase domain-containing protein [Halobacterium bonnevillei]
MRSAVILAGGRSTRYGDGDKALADLGGTPMLRRVADRLDAVTDELVVNCRADQRDGHLDALDGYSNPVRVALDPEPDEGPMAGIAAGLREARGEYGAVVACDMPFVDPAVVDRLFDRADGHDAAVPEMDDGWYQTTQAVYRADAMAAACEAALERGDRKILAPLGDLDWVAVPEADVASVGDVTTFENLNTRDAVDDAASRF